MPTKPDTETEIEQVRRWLDSEMVHDMEREREYLEEFIYAHPTLAQQFAGYFESTGAEFELFHDGAEFYPERIGGEIEFWYRYGRYRATVLNFQELLSRIGGRLEYEDGRFTVSRSE